MPIIKGQDTPGISATSYIDILKAIVINASQGTTMVVKTLGNKA